MDCYRVIGLADKAFSRLDGRPELYVKMMKEESAGDGKTPKGSKSYDKLGRELPDRLLSRSI